MALHSDLDPTDCHSRLIQAAVEVFIEEGYRASVDRVATRAGVARQTLYNHFSSKAELFGEVVRQATAALLITLGGEDKNLRERLVRFAAMYREKVLSAEGLGFFRALAAETVRFPELAATFYRTGPAQTAKTLSTVLQDAMERGELRREAPDFAAKMLLSMLDATDRSHYLFSGDLPSTPSATYASQIVDCFLRAFAPELPTPSPLPQRSAP